MRVTATTMRVTATPLFLLSLPSLISSLRVAPGPKSTSRRSFIASTPSFGAAVLGGARLAWAQDDKLTGLSNEAIADLVRKDLVDNQFLVNGRLTRSIYDESATFTDEIDTCQSVHLTCHPVSAFAPDSLTRAAAPEPHLKRLHSTESRRA